MLESAVRGTTTFNWEESMWGGATFNDDDTLTFRGSFDINSNGLPVIIDSAAVASYTDITPNDEAIVSLGGTVGPEGN